MSLYKKYRPKNLKNVQGNIQVVSALKNMLEEKEKIPSAILFSGPTGCGKTTLGRIIKTALGITDMDYKEINSSEMRGIDTVRDIIKNSQYAPLESPYRLYLIDECHKMTNDAQNALLKPLEDTPEHVIFILCTTEPEKLIKPIRGRCQNFPLSTLTDKEMEGLINKVLKKEKEALEDKIKLQIIDTAEGHPRNALNILEKVLSVDPKERLNAAKVFEEEQANVKELCQALLKGFTWGRIKNILSGLKGTDAETIRRGVVYYMQAVLLGGDNERAGLIMEEFIEPFYHTGFPQVVFACYSIVKN